MRYIFNPVSNFFCMQFSPCFEDLFEVNANLQFIEYDLFSQQKTPGKTPVCKVCNKEFKSRTILYRHRQTHMEKTIQCGVCQKMFSTVSQVQSHQAKLKHDRIIKCMPCNLTYTHVMELKVSRRFCIKIKQLTPTSINNNCSLFSLPHTGTSPDARRQTNKRSSVSWRKHCVYQLQPTSINAVPAPGAKSSINDFRRVKENSKLSVSVRFKIKAKGNSHCSYYYSPPSPPPPLPYNNSSKPFWIGKLDNNIVFCLTPDHRNNIRRRKEKTTFLNVIDKMFVSIPLYTLYGFRLKAN